MRNTGNCGTNEYCLIILSYSLPQTLLSFLFGNELNIWKNVYAFKYFSVLSIFSLESEIQILKIFSISELKS